MTYKEAKILYHKFPTIFEEILKLAARGKRPIEEIKRRGRILIFEETLKIALELESEDQIPIVIPKWAKDIAALVTLTMELR